MPNHFPYTSTDYLSDNFKPSELSLDLRRLTKNEVRHFHDEVEFLLIASGQCTIEINHCYFSVSAGDLIQLAPFHVHRFLIGDQPIDFWHIKLSLGVLIFASTDRKTYLNTIKNLDRTIPIVHLDHASYDHLVGTFQRLHEEKNLPVTGIEGFHLATAALLSFYFQKFLQRKKSTDKLSLAWLILQYIHFHHQEPITLASTAQFFELPVKTVQDTIKQLTGYSFKALLNQVRIRNAYVLLQLEDLSINQIAKICGYRSEANFYKQFDKRYHVSPAEARTQFHHTEMDTQAWDIALYLLAHSRESLQIEDVVQQMHLSQDTINDRLKKTFGLSFKALHSSIKKQVQDNLHHRSTSIHHPHDAV